MVLFGLTIFTWVLFGLTIFTCLLMWRWVHTTSKDNPRRLMGSIGLTLLLVILATRVLFDV